ncbi:MAG: Gfo/Idh/MocA family oxidoreductase [Bryobacteraceae bacterium]|nr:Gfo/Idh/MocA family oxidoreductase [Bryobacteraceae bacterium]
MIDNRRQFLKAGTAAALSQARVRGANNRIRIAGIGCGGRCRYLLGLVNEIGGAEIVSVCDVYGPRRRETVAKIAPGAAEEVEYRRVLERKDIDAVVIGSPDHWHVPMTIDAIQAGKDVYVEKPVSHTIQEGEQLRRAARDSRQVIQVGYQQRSWPHFDQARRIVASGRLGKITLVLASWYQTYLEFNPATAPVEEAELDWKRWLGSAPGQPLNAARFYRWRWFWDFGGGHLTDLYSHWCDTIHWLLDAGVPKTAQAAGGKYAFDFQECPDTINAFWEYPGDFAIVYNGTMHCHLDGGTIVFRGGNAMLRINRDGFAVYPEGIVARERTEYPEPEIRMRSLRDGTIDHVRNFLDCVRSRKQPNADVNSAIDAANAAHFGNLAYRKGARLPWRGAETA